MASFAISAIRMKTSACGEKIITPMSDPNSGLKAGLDLPDNLARPRWSQFHGVCRRHGRNCQPCWCKVRGKPVLCSRWGELLWSCPHPECVSSTQAPSCTAALPRILCSYTGWWPRADLVLAQMLWKDRARDPGLGKSALHVFDGLCDSSNLLNKLHPVS